MDLVLKQIWPTSLACETNIYTRDPPRNDLPTFKSAANDNLGGQRFCVINHHNRSFETNSKNTTNEDKTNHNHHKIQHFIRGKIPGVSYRDTEQVRGHTKDGNKEGGFLYGTSAIKRFEKKDPATRPNNKLMLEEITDSQRTKHQKLAADKDNYLGRYYEMKARQNSKIASEKKKDLEMLKSYNPWGKPGGGAPRGYKNNEVDANVTKHVRKLKEEDNRQTRVGGGGSPKRTTSGNVVTFLKTDPEIRFQAAQYNTDVDPGLRYKPDHAYGKELDALVQESINRKTLQRRKSLEEEIQQIECNPFGSQTRVQKKGVMQQKSLSESNVYDPWGKGYGGIPERKENGKILKNVQGLNTEPKAKHWVSYGMSSNDSFDKMQKRKKGTLSKNTYGQILVRDFSPKESSYSPWGKPGAGAPLRDGQGNILTANTGKLNHGNMEGESAQLKRDPVRKKEYLKSLEKQQHENEISREQERSNNNRRNDVDVANWVRQGKVGRPNYDSQTKEIRANPKNTSDVTREKFQIRRLKNDNSKCYYEDLQEMADERNRRRQVEKTKERKLSFDHVETMNNFWGRPGGGAPMITEQTSFSRKHSELFPTNKSIFR